VRSTKEPRGITDARPKRSTDARRRFCAEHRGTEGEPQDKAKEEHRCEAQVSCGAPRNQGEAPMRGRRGAPMRGGGFVRSTEEPRGNTKVRPKRSTDARRRFRAEHRGTEGEHRGKAEEEHRCEAQVLCGAPRNRGGSPRQGQRGAPMRGAGFVRSPEEPRGSTEARPKRSKGARRISRAKKTTILDSIDSCNENIQTRPSVTNPNYRP
jgi:hypothetical protein